jgi:hypothetical protein
MTSVSSVSSLDTLASGIINSIQLSIGPGRLRFHIPKHRTTLPIPRRLISYPRIEGVRSNGEVPGSLAGLGLGCTSTKESNKLYLGLSIYAALSMSSLA